MESKRSTEDVTNGTPSQFSDQQITSNLRYDAETFVPRSHNAEAPLADALTRAILSSRLPIPEPPIFTGDPLQYQDWLFSFQSLIENKGVPPQERIHFLKRYLGGPAKEAVSGYFMLRSENAYQRARNVLDERFGNSFIVSEAFRSKLDAWSSVHNKDKQGLRKLSDFLLQCQTALEEVNDLNILNDIREIKKITAKLPDWMIHRWNRKTAISKRDKGRYPTLKKFVVFVNEESEIVNDPMLSTETHSAPKPKKHSTSRYLTRQLFSTATQMKKCVNFARRNIIL
jgi:hypothetical protein